MIRFTVRLAPLGLLWVLAVTARVPAEAADAQLPNIILCMADDQGWGDVGYYGKSPVKTPVLDEMAAAALRFDRFYAAAPVCSPTRGSVLTGRHPNRFGCFSWGHTLRPQEVTIAEALRSAGYTSGHFGKWHLGEMFADSPVSPGHSGFDEWLSSPNFFENDPLLSHRGKVVQRQGESSRVTVDAALDFIRACAQRKQPFLAVVWFGSPHSPHIASDEFRALYADQPERLQHFLGELSGIDSALGHLRRELRGMGIADNTLLWYTSDNGALPVGSTGGLSGRKGRLEEGGIRVPAIIEWPARIKQPRITRIPAGTVDIYPTLLEIAGVSVPQQPPLDGISLLPLIDGRLERRDKPLGFWVYPTRGIPMRSSDILRKLREDQAAGRPPDARDDAGRITTRYAADQLPGPAAWIDGDFKLHRRVNQAGQAAYTLHHLVDDPQEKIDVAEQHAPRAAQMKADLQSWQQSVVGSLNGEDYQP